MNSTSSIYVHSQTALPKEYSNLLKEGSSVLVRILKQTGKNKFTASFAGGRFSVTSKDALKPGSTFMARISFDGGKLNLIRTAQSVQNQSEIQNKNIIQQFNTLTPELSQMLLSLGLASDGISKMLLQTLIACGGKFNLEKLARARNAAVNFTGQEEEASEAALILIEKGIEPTDENIRKVMQGFLKENEALSKFSVEKTDYEDDDENTFLKEIKNEIKNFFEDVLKKGGDAKPGSGDADSGEGDALTMFNHMASRDCEGHFVVVPFDFEFSRNQKKTLGNGVFRLILDFKKKNVLKSVINFNTIGKIWNFVIDFNGNDVKKVRFCQISDKVSAPDPALEQKLKVFFPDTSVEMVLPEKMFGFASVQTEIPVIKGFA